MKSSLLKLLVLLFVLCPFVYSNQVYLTLIKEVTLDAVPIDIILNEDLAYVITGGTVHAFTTSDPYNLTQYSYQELSGTKSLSFTGRIAYSLGTDNQINLYDFTKDPPVKKTLSEQTAQSKKLQ